MFPARPKFGSPMNHTAVITKADCIEALAQGIEEYTANSNVPAKVLARRLNTTVESLANWRKRRNCPSFYQFVQMYLTVPEVQVAFAKLTQDAALGQEASDYQLDLDRLVRFIATGGRGPAP